MLKDICEQYMFSRTARIQKLPRLDSPYLKMSDNYRGYTNGCRVFNYTRYTSR